MDAMGLFLKTHSNPITIPSNPQIRFFLKRQVSEMPRAAQLDPEKTTGDTCWETKEVVSWDITKEYKRTLWLWVWIKKHTANTRSMYYDIYIYITVCLALLLVPFFGWWVIRGPKSKVIRVTSNYGIKRSRLESPGGYCWWKKHPAPVDR